MARTWDLLNKFFSVLFSTFLQDDENLLSPLPLCMIAIKGVAPKGVLQKIILLLLYDFFASCNKLTMTSLTEMLKDFLKWEWFFSQTNFALTPTRDKIVWLSVGHFLRCRRYTSGRILAEAKPTLHVARYTILNAVCFNTGSLIVISKCRSYRSRSKNNFDEHATFISIEVKSLEYSKFT